MTPPIDDEGVKHDADSGTYRTQYDPDEDGLALRILEAVAAIRGVEPTALDPLSEYVDPDALGTIFEPIQSQVGAHGSLSFDYEGLLVVVHSDGEIVLHERE